MEVSVMPVNKTAIVEKLFQIAAEGKWGEVSPLLHPEFEVIPAASHPYAGSYRGIRGFQEIFQKVFVETYDVFEPTVLEFAEGPTRVVAISSVKVTGKRTGRTITTSLAEVFQFEDDKLKTIIPHYLDTKLLVEL
jgi:ketosteroid isomerase-like protein